MRSFRLTAMVVAVTAISCLSGCSGCAVKMQVARNQADNAIADFHGRYNGEKFDEIIDEAADEFKKSAPRENLLKFLNRVHRRLGKVKNSKELGWRVNFTTGGTIVVSTHEAEFENGKGTETFTVVVRDGKARIVGYNVNSDKLVFE